MTKAPIRTWREPIDRNKSAAIAFVEFVFRGGYYAAGAFAIIDNDNRQWREAGEYALRAHVVKNHGGRVPYLGRARDIDRG